jgi:hypothetical protein
MTTLLPRFEYQHVEVEGVTVNCATAGSGSPVLMLHGYPQNHLMWRDVAPALAEDHTVVLADLRGYGDSDKPEPDAAGDAYLRRGAQAPMPGPRAVGKSGIRRPRLPGPTDPSCPAFPTQPPRGPGRNHGDVTSWWSGARRCDIVVVPEESESGHTGLPDPVASVVAVVSIWVTCAREACVRAPSPRNRQAGAPS